MLNEDILQLSLLIKHRSGGGEDLLLPEEMASINYKEIIHIANQLGVDNAELAVEVQWFYYKNRKMSNEQQLKEVNAKILEFEEKYASDFNTVFGHLVDNEEVDTIDEALDYSDWLELLERKAILGGG